jgi:hypothetical protein
MHRKQKNPKKEKETDRIFFKKGWKPKRTNEWTQAKDKKKIQKQKKESNRICNQKIGRRGVARSTPYRMPISHPSDPVGKLFPAGG